MAKRKSARKRAPTKGSKVGRASRGEATSTRARGKSKQVLSKSKRLRKSPTAYTVECGVELCRLLGASPPQSLTAVCEERGMPNRATVFKWLELHEEFAAAYADARRSQAHAAFDHILELCDELAASGLAHEDITALKVRIDTLKWATSKLLPKVYGDKLTLGGDADAPLRFAQAREVLGDKLGALRDRHAAELRAGLPGHLAACGWEDDATYACAPGCPTLRGVKELGDGDA